MYHQRTFVYSVNTASGNPPGQKGGAHPSSHPSMHPCIQPPIHPSVASRVSPPLSPLVSGGGRTSGVHTSHPAAHAMIASRFLVSHQTVANSTAASLLYYCDTLIPAIAAFCDILHHFTLPYSPSVDSALPCRGHRSVILVLANQLPPSLARSVIPPGATQGGA